MSSTKLAAGKALPDIAVAKLGGGEIHLPTPPDSSRCRLIVVYRGKHCPICTSYLAKLNELLPQFRQIGVDVVAISADTAEKAKAHMKKVSPDFDVGSDLSVNQMRELGLYISSPISSSETDRPFAEPALLAVNARGDLQIIDISNAPFSRPEPASVLMGLKFILNPDNNYPVRGTH